MSPTVSDIINTIAPVTCYLNDSSQLALFPQLRSLQVVPECPKSITLPRSILVIQSDEQLNQYLSRVAAAAVTAATKACGSPQSAAARLGTAEQEPTDERNQSTTKGAKRNLRLAR